MIFVSKKRSSCKFKVSEQCITQDRPLFESNRALQNCKLTHLSRPYIRHKSWHIVTLMSRRSDIRVPDFLCIYTNQSLISYSSTFGFHEILLEGMHVNKSEQDVS